jgi:pimeloyl-ACP methyl ester carboxylesterase
MPDREPHAADFRVTAGARLHHLDAGRGDPVLLLHGSLTDARYWQRSGLLPALAAHFRVVAPSRRHNHPHPASDLAGYAAGDDATDALELIAALGLGSVHLVGHSYGAFAALLLAAERPDLVRSLVLAEPPLMRWLPLLPGGEGIWEGFEASTWRRLGAAFEESDAAGLEATARWYFGRAFAEIDPVWQDDFRAAAREWRALTTSADAFPFVPVRAGGAPRRPHADHLGGPQRPRLQRRDRRRPGRADPRRAPRRHPRRRPRDVPRRPRRGGDDAARVLRERRGVGARLPRGDSGRAQRRSVQLPDTPAQRSVSGRRRSRSGGRKATAATGRPGPTWSGSPSRTCTVSGELSSVSIPSCTT